MPIVTSNSHQAWVKVAPQRRKAPSREQQVAALKTGMLGFFAGTNLDVPPPPIPGIETLGELGKGTGNLGKTKRKGPIPCPSYDLVVAKPKDLVRVSDMDEIDGGRRRGGGGGSSSNGGKGRGSHGREAARTVSAPAHGSSGAAMSKRGRAHHDYEDDYVEVDYDRYTEDDYGHSDYEDNYHHQSRQHSNGYHSSRPNGRGPPPMPPSRSQRLLHDQPYHDPYHHDNHDDYRSYGNNRLSHQPSYHRPRPRGAPSARIEAAPATQRHYGAAMGGGHGAHRAFSSNHAYDDYYRPRPQPSRHPGGGYGYGSSARSVVSNSWMNATKALEL